MIRILICTVFYLLFMMESVPAQQRLTFEGRDLILENPNAMKSGGPIILILHGRGERPDNMLRMEMLREATQRNATLVYPSASEHRRPRIWRDGRQPSSEGNEDTLYLQRVIRHLKENGNNRVFLIGVSSGAMMAYRMLCEAPEILDGVVAMIGNMPEPLKESCEAKRMSVRFMAINGDRDEIVSIHGGPVCSIGMPGCAGGRVLSFQDSLNIIAGMNGCSGGMGRAVGHVSAQGEDAGSLISLSQGSGCRAETVGVIAHGMGHEWPMRFFEGAGWNAKGIMLDFLIEGRMPQKQG